jgi:hypothetical protein
MNDAETPISRFDFTSGELRGTSLTLYPGCVVHRGGAQLETIPVAGIAAARVGFERNLRRVGWAIALLLAALVLFSAADPIAGFAGGEASRLAEQLRANSTAAGQSVTGVLHGTFRVLEAAARLLPTLAWLLVLAAALLGVLGWLGRTTLTLTLAAVERDYAVRGRSAMLFDFAELVSEQLMQRR